jgi:hypothetical protein
MEDCYEKLCSGVFLHCSAGGGLLAVVPAAACCADSRCDDSIFGSAHTCFPACKLGNTFSHSLTWFGAFI